MQTSKKVILSCVSFLLVLVLVSAALVEPTLRLETERIHYDAGIRRETAGSYDFIFIGDSDGLLAFDAKVFDAKTGKKSMNLSGTDITQGSEYYLLKKEMKRNPIQTVYLQISYDTFVKDPDVSLGEGDARTVQRLDTAFERMEFLLTQVRVNDWLNIYSRLMAAGISFWKETLANRGIVYYEPPTTSSGDAQGQSGTKVSLTQQEAAELYNTSSVNLEFRKDHIKQLQKIIRLCKDNDVELVFVVVPVADSYLWQLDNLDAFEQKARAFCEENGVEFYDFNLIKQRKQLIEEDAYFSDYWHANSSGAKVFSEYFSQFVNKKESGDNLTNLFVDSYETIRSQFSYKENELGNH